MITCRRCGLVNGDGANYCDQCGSELVPIHMQTRAASFEDDAWYASHALRCIVIGLVAFAGVALMLVKGTLGYALLSAAIGTISFAMAYLL